MKHDSIIVTVAIFIVIVNITATCLINRSDNDKVISEGLKIVRNPTNSYPTVTSEFGGTYIVVVIDGCQYLASQTYAGHYVVSHKGNCTNIIHKTNFNVEK